MGNWPGVHKMQLLSISYLYITFSFHLTNTATCMHDMHAGTFRFDDQYEIVMGMTFQI